MSPASAAVPLQQTPQLHNRLNAFRSVPPRRVAYRVQAAQSSSGSSTPQQQLIVSRRAVIAAPVGILLFSGAKQAAAFTTPPPGYRYHQDKLDGYSFFYPEDWAPVTTSGNDVFYRNPFNIEENLFVDVSSPSSSKYASVEDLGSPQEAAQRTLEQYLGEFMSTRLGVKRTAEVVEASSRTGADGNTYYDVQIRAKSYASRNQLAVSQQEVDEGIVLEWDRRYLAVLGVANKRLYQFRLQTSTASYEKDQGRLRTSAESFQCKEVL